MNVPFSWCISLQAHGSVEMEETKTRPQCRRISPLFHQWPHLTLFPAADMSFPLKLHVVLNKWVSSESPSRTNQHTGLVSKWRVHSAAEEGYCFLIPPGRGMGHSNSEGIGALFLHSGKEITPLSHWKLMLPPEHSFPSRLPTPGRNCFQLHASKKWMWP